MILLRWQHRTCEKITFHKSLGANFTLIKNLIKLLIT